MRLTFSVLGGIYALMVSATVAKGARYEVRILGPTNVNQEIAWAISDGRVAGW